MRVAAMPKSKRYKNKICLFGHFGAGNFGNESTLQALLYHLRRLMPDAELRCICTAPEIVAADYKIDALPISGVVVKPWKVRNPLARLARKIFVGLPSELYRWLKGIATLQDTDMLIVVGTGLLTDAFSIGGWGPYSTFKWSMIAKLCDCQLVFVSVGAGPLRSTAGRFFVKSALSLANFRSYRDEATRKYLKDMGLRCDQDPVYPDLAFSLPTTSIAHSSPRKSGRPMVGLGLMVHGGMYGIEKTTSEDYAAYMRTLVDFVKWLLNRGYDIRLLIGDRSDISAVYEFKSLLSQQVDLCKQERVLAEPIESASDLLSQLATTDFVVATRFHNVLLALFLNKPSIAISFHHKCSSLMSRMDLSEYCIDIKRLNGDNLIEKFLNMEKNAANLTQMIKSKGEACRVALDEQYRQIIEALGMDYECPSGLKPEPPMLTAPAVADNPSVRLPGRE